MSWKTTPLAGIALILVTGCGITQTMPAKPPKPTIPTEKITEENDRVCFSKDAAIDLGRYIEALEAGYQ